MNKGRPASDRRRGRGSRDRIGRTVRVRIPHDRNRNRDMLPESGVQSQSADRVDRGTSRRTSRRTGRGSRPRLDRDGLSRPAGGDTDLGRRIPRRSAKQEPGQTEDAISGDLQARGCGESSHVGTHIRPICPQRGAQPVICLSAVCWSWRSRSNNIPLELNSSRR